MYSLISLAMSSITAFAESGIEVSFVMEEWNKIISSFWLCRVLLWTPHSEWKSLLLFFPVWSFSEYVAVSKKGFYLTS